MYSTGVFRQAVIEAIERPYDNTEAVNLISIDGYRAEIEWTVRTTSGKTRYTYHLVCEFDGVSPKCVSSKGVGAFNNFFILRDFPLEVENRIRRIAELPPACGQSDADTASVNTDKKFDERCGESCDKDHNNDALIGCDFDGSVLRIRYMDGGEKEARVEAKDGRLQLTTEYPYPAVVERLIHGVYAQKVTREQKENVF